jgi:Tol biopolymer transport system component
MNSHGLDLWRASVSRDGRRLVINKQHVRLDIYVGELKEKGTRLDPPTRLSESDSYDSVSAWTHDSKAILFSSNRTGRSQMFKQQLGQGTAEPLIQGPEDEMSAKLSPDGNWILYESISHDLGGAPPTTTRLMRLPALGGTPEKVMDLGENDSDFGCPSQSGTSCVLGRSEQGQLVFYAMDPVRGLGKELARTKLGPPADWSISPDGLRIAISGWDQLPEKVRVLDLRNGTERTLPLPHGWILWAHDWAADSNALFAAAQSKSTGYMIVRIELDGKISVLLDRGRSQWLGSPCPSPDGRHLAFSQQTFENNAWLLENF